MEAHRVSAAVCIWMSVCTLTIPGTMYAQENAQSSAVEDDPCNFTVEASHDADKEQLKEDLIAKLRDYDACMGRLGDEVGRGSQGSSKGAGGETNNENGNGSESGEGQESANAEGRLASEQSTPENTSEESPPNQNKQTISGITNPLNIPAAVQSTIPQSINPAGKGIVEDDVAKMLREAAEKETDPTRKASLYKSYQDYLNSRSNSRR